MMSLLLGEGGSPVGLHTPPNWTQALEALLEASCSEECPLLLIVDRV